MRTASEQQASWGARRLGTGGDLGKDGPGSCWNRGFSFWGFPYLGVPLVIIYFHGIFHNKNQAFWGSSMYGNSLVGVSCFHLPLAWLRRVPWGRRLKFHEVVPAEWKSNGQHSDEQGDEGDERLAACNQRCSTASSEHWDDHSLDVGTCSTNSLVASTASVIFGDPWKDYCNRDIRDQTTGVIQMRWDGRSDR